MAAVLVFIVFATFSVTFTIFAMLNRRHHERARFTGEEPGWPAVARPGRRQVTRQLEVNEQVCPDCHGYGIAPDPADRNSTQCSRCRGFGTVLDGEARP